LVDTGCVPGFDFARRIAQFSFHLVLIFEHLIYEKSSYFITGRGSRPFSHWSSDAEINSNAVMQVREVDILPSSGDQLELSLH